MSNDRMLHNLPVAAYISRDWFDREQELIFSKVWRYAGFVEDIAEPGDYLAVQAGLNNIFVVMGQDRQLRAFHNICRHRGAQLLRSVGKAKKSITCPYHDWSYDLDGNLKAVPSEAKEFGKIDKTCLGLKPASVATWRGMLFVHPDPNAGEIRDWLGEIESKLGPHEVDSLVEDPDSRTTYEIAANWKIVVENYIDVYHLSHLHSGTLSMYDHSKAEYGFVGPHFAFREPLSRAYAAELEKNTPLPLIVPPDQAGAWVPMLFPGIGLAESESTWSTFILTPLSPERTRVENRTRVKDASSWAFAKQSIKSASFWSNRIKPKYKDSDADDPMGSADFTQEDVYACEQQQKSLRSPYFSVGPASKGESPVLDHQKVVLEWMGGWQVP